MLDSSAKWGIFSFETTLEATDSGLRLILFITLSLHCACPSTAPLTGDWIQCRPNQFSIWALIAGFAALRISRNAMRAGLLADLCQMAHKGMAADLGVIGRILT